jgi:hypothetical protein
MKEEEVWGDVDCRVRMREEREDGGGVGGE